MPLKFLISKHHRDSIGLDFKNSIIAITNAHNLDTQWQQLATAEVSISKCAKILQKPESLGPIAKLVRAFRYIIQNKTKTDDVWKLVGYKNGWWVAEINSIFKQVNDAFKMDNTSTINSFTKSAKADRNKPQNKKHSRKTMQINYENPVGANEESKGMQNNEDTNQMSQIDNSIFDKFDAQNLSKWRELWHNVVQTVSSQSCTQPEVQSIADMLDILYDQLCIKSNKSYDFALWIVPDCEPTKDTPKIEKLTLLWLNPMYIMNQVYSLGQRWVILTSRSLSPMSLYENELGNFPIKFQNKLEVVEDRVMVNILNKGNSNGTFNFIWKERFNDGMFKEMGETIVQLVKTVPGGVLVFFPSFSFMGTVISNWRNNSLFIEMDNYKNVYIESNKDHETEKKLKDFQYDVDNKDGAIFMGIWRGKAMEAIRVSDKGARCIIMVSVPYGPWTDYKYKLKMSFMTLRYQRKLSKINGNIWYDQDTARATNQTISRIITHKNDYGVVILADKRYSETELISSSPQASYEFDDLIVQIRSFFSEVTADLPSDPNHPAITYTPFVNAIEDDDDFVASRIKDRKKATRIEHFFSGFSKKSNSSDKK